MILDLHNHSIKSDDGRAKVENYCKWITKRELKLDGFVLSEHRQYDSGSDYRALEDEYGILILKASEVETEYGHVLLFGVNDDLEHAFDFADVRVPLEVVLRESNRCGAFAVPCHPSRAIVGMPTGDGHRIGESRDAPGFAPVFAPLGRTGPRIPSRAGLSLYVTLKLQSATMHQRRSTVCCRQAGATTPPRGTRPAPRAAAARKT